MKKITVMLALAIVFTFNAIAPAFGGAIGGKQSGTYVIAPYTTHTFQIAFRGGEYASVAVIGDGSTDLDVFIQDAWGRPVDSRNDYTDFCVDVWYVRSAAFYTVTIVNRGGRYNSYGLGTN